MTTLHQTYDRESRTFRPDNPCPYVDRIPLDREPPGPCHESGALVAASAVVGVLGLAAGVLAGVARILVGVIGGS